MSKKYIAMLTTDLLCGSSVGCGKRSFSSAVEIVVTAQVSVAAVVAIVVVQ
jgi:hypothetical protein